MGVMEFLLAFIFLFLIDSFVGCTNTHSVSLEESSGNPTVLYIDGFNSRMRNVHFDVLTNDGQSFSARNVVLGPDSTSFKNLLDSSQISIPTSDIE